MMSGGGATPAQRGYIAQQIVVLLAHCTAEQDKFSPTKTEVQNM